MSTRTLFPPLHSLASSLDAASEDIPDQRKQTLEDLAAWINERHASGKPADLVFICTHNSRRSHMAQLWTQAAAWVHGLDHVRTYSGGTEATALNSSAVEALSDCGFHISVESDGENPQYRFTFADDADPVIAYSKEYGHPDNPKKDFAAVMTCSDADEACPIVLGASARFATTYQDPKEADGTDKESETYANRCRQIGAEMLYMIRHAAEMAG